VNKDNRKTTELLKAQLDFIEKGGYGRSVKTPWPPTSVFQDFLSCLNFADPEKTHPCSVVPVDGICPAFALGTERELPSHPHRPCRGNRGRLRPPR